MSEHYELMPRNSKPLFKNNCNIFNDVTGIRSRNEIGENIIVISLRLLNIKNNEVGNEKFKKFTLWLRMVSGC
jgi:hypothetical protein